MERKYIKMAPLIHVFRGKVSGKIVVSLSFLLLTSGLLLAGFQQRELKSKFFGLQEELEAIKQDLASLRLETIALDIFITGGAVEEEEVAETQVEIPNPPKNMKYEMARRISEAGVWEIKRIECEPEKCVMLMESGGERKSLEVRKHNIATFVAGDRIKFGLITSISIPKDAITDALVKGPKIIPAWEVSCLKYPAYSQLSHCYEVSDYLVVAEHQ